MRPQPLQLDLQPRRRRRLIGRRRCFRLRGGVGKRPGADRAGRALETVRRGTPLVSALRPAKVGKIKGRILEKQVENFIRQHLVAACIRGEVVPVERGLTVVAYQSPDPCVLHPSGNPGLLTPRVKCETVAKFSGIIS